MTTAPLVSVGLRRLSGVALMFVALGAGGCGVRKGDVSGQVLFDGKPLPSGRVTFLCEGGNKPVLTAEIRDGSYAIAAAPAGPCKITVATPQMKFTPVPGMPKGMTAPPPSSDAHISIPTRYENADQSRLTYEIQGGPQTHNIELTP